MAKMVKMAKMAKSAYCAKSAKMDQIDKTLKIVENCQNCFSIFKHLSYNNKVSLKVQRKAFAAQVSLALRLKLPLVLHIRRAEKERRQLLQELGVPASWPMHRHCFKGCIIICL